MVPRIEARIKILTDHPSGNVSSVHTTLQSHGLMYLHTKRYWTTARAREAEDDWLCMKLTSMQTYLL